MVRTVTREEHELVRGRAHERHDVIRHVSGCSEEVGRAVVDPDDGPYPTIFGVDAVF